MMKILSYLVLFLALMPTSIQAQQRDSTGQEIFTELDRRRSSIEYEKAEMKMTIFNGRGAKRQRTLESFSANTGDKSKSLLLFKDPANIRGTGFLTISEGNNELQKLYLPALKRIQTISPSQKSDRFMGSDFTYEDLGDQNPDDYRFSLEAKTDTAFILHTSKKENSQYHHLKFYIDPEKYALLKVEYFNSDNIMVKKLIAEKHIEVKKDVWLPQKMTMFDLKNNRKTELNWKNRIVGNSIPEWRFTERGLRRGL